MVSLCICEERPPPSSRCRSRILHYVVRTEKSVILDDASASNPFSSDTYIVQHHARSLLCLPLVRQAKLIGVLYLENNLTSHVFTPRRVAVLKLLASQAASSLENTRLYRDLEEREAKIRTLKDQLYRENLALRDEVDPGLDVRGNCRYLNGIASRAFPHCQSCSNRVHRFHYGRDWDGQGTHRARRSQTVPKVRTRFVSVNCAAMAPSLIQARNYSAMRREPSPELRSVALAVSSWLTAERFSWTKWANFRRTPKSYS